MEMVLVQPANRLIAGELDCDLDLISGHGVTAYDADDTYTEPAPQPVGLSRRQLSETERFEGLF
jgi:hypothetical protein